MNALNSKLSDQQQAAAPAPNADQADATQLDLPKCGGETVQGGINLLPPEQLAALDKKFLTAIQIDVLSGEHVGESRTVNAGQELIVGRGPPSDWQLAKEGCLSRRHFQINVHPDHGRLIDLGSTNGTVINDRRESAIDLQNGDYIKCGKTTFKIKLVTSSAEPDTGSTVQF